MVEQDDGTIDPSDWAVGFLQAMALCQDGWEPLLRDQMAGALIAPIMLIASTSDRADLQLDEDERLPDAEMAKLLAESQSLLGLCVAAMRTLLPEASQAVVRAKVLGRPKRKRR